MKRSILAILLISTCVLCAEFQHTATKEYWTRKFYHHSYTLDAKESHSLVLQWLDSNGYKTNAMNPDVNQFEISVTNNKISFSFLSEHNTNNK